jgi:peptidoglycan L-alanyl-D-glutamate endopeptidase CwlK
MIERNEIKLEELYPPFRARIERLLDFCDQKGWKVIITQALRTFEDQDALYAKGRDEKGIVIDPSQVITNAKGGESYHNYGLAIDLAFLDDSGSVLWESPLYDELGANAKLFNLHWLGALNLPFKDIYHFDANFGYSTWELSVVYLNDNKLPGVWKYIDEGLA